MENHRGSVPSSANSLNSSKNERGGLSMVNSNGGYVNASSSAGGHFSGPPGFGVPSGMNSSGSSMQNFQSLHPGHGTGYQNIYSFDKPYNVNEEYGLQSGYGYSPFYPNSSSHGLPVMSNQQGEFLQPSRYGTVQQGDISSNSNGFELDSGLGVLLRSKNGNSVPFGGNNNLSTSHTMNGQSNNNENGVIKPMIDNIVGSMGIWNGTYTHFGPVEPVTPRFSSEIPQSYLRPEPRMADPAPLMDNFVHPPNSVDYVTGKESPVSNVVGSAVRAGTPSNESASRPHTPGKPSYSEILAKNAAQNISGTAGSVKSLPLTSPSPPLNSNNSISSPYQAKETITSSGTASRHRKSVDSILSTNSSASSSLCTSASSSPVAKQKNVQSLMGRFFNPLKGKENTDVANKHSYNYNAAKSNSSATNTPTQTKKFGLQTAKSSENVHVINDKKVFNPVQNPPNAFISKPVKSNILPKPVKLQEAPQSSNGNFSFEIEDLDDGIDDLGWKTYTSRGTNKNSANRPNSRKIKNEAVSSSNPINVDNAMDDSDNSNENEPTDNIELSKRDISNEKRSSNASLTGGVAGSGSATTGAAGTSQKKAKGEKEKVRGGGRKDSRNCMVRRLERFAFVWAAHLISAVSWLFKLITDVVTLSITVGSTLVEDLYSWWMNKALPTCVLQYQSVKENMYRFVKKSKEALKWKIRFRRQSNDEESERKKSGEDLLAALGPERNITLPTNGDEALKRLLSVGGQDPYCILGVRSDSSDETIRRYYKKQAVLVHPDKNLVPGAEEAFKILARAFELLGEPAKRQEYHHKLLEAHTKEQVYGEIGKLLEQLRKKMEIATGSIRCTKCNLRHKKNKTDRPLFAARYCAQCSIHHGAREGELWAERKGWFGLTWNYFACMDCHIWEINEWAKCQKKNLLHIKADSHCVMYRLVAGNGNNQQGQQQTANCTSATSEGHVHPDRDDDWDSLINNLCKTSGGVPGGKPGSHFYQQGKSNAGSCCSGAANPSASGTNRKRKGKRK